MKPKQSHGHELPCVVQFARRSWDIHLDTMQMGGFAYDRDAAIRLAIREAKLEEQAGLSIIVRSQRQNGETTTEWS